jgi:ferredoxin
MPAKLTNAQFLERANSVHGGKYEYPEFYVRANIKMTIVCPEHGPFKQMPRSHLLGQGCRLCAFDKNAASRRSSLDEFIGKASLIHGDRYEYPDPYEKSDIKIRIICHLHGPFYQTPNSHLSGSGCPICGNVEIGNNQRLSFDEFKARAIDLHGDKYDYPDQEYIDTKTHIKIICRIHGIFEQSPNNHLQGKGCRFCRDQNMSLDRRDSVDEFIDKAKLIHPNNEYDYSLVVYTNNMTKVQIICNDCSNIFEQAPANHLSGNGCSYCFGASAWTSEIFANKGREVHGDKYDYSLVDYVSSQTKVNIICNECKGIFEQTPAAHINRCQGCFDCAVIRNANKLRKTLGQFIDEATAIFGNRYSYDKVDYINTATNVIISCNKCGAEFLQTPCSHLIGSGCPKCPVIVSKSESEWLDYIGIPEKFRQKPLKIKRTRPYIVDAYVPETNTIYEFYDLFAKNTTSLVLVDELASS